MGASLAAKGVVRRSCSMGSGATAPLVSTVASATTVFRRPFTDPRAVLARARAVPAARGLPTIPSSACSTILAAFRRPVTTLARRPRRGCGRRRFATSASIYRSTRCAATGPMGSGRDRRAGPSPVGPGNRLCHGGAGAPSGRRPRSSPPSTGPVSRRAAATVGCILTGGFRTSIRPSFSGAACAVTGTRRRSSSVTPSPTRARTATSRGCCMVS